MDSDSETESDISIRRILGLKKPKRDSARFHGPLESSEYCMSNRGKCYIFNHETFNPETKKNEREGTNVDAASLYRRFSELGFTCEVFKNGPVRKVMKILEEAAKEDHSDNSCFVCCILTHGDPNNLYAEDGIYSADDVFSIFHGDKCKSLVGKPKLFFIQACEGDDKKSKPNAVPANPFDSIVKIPTHADFLIHYSTVPGFYSWKNDSQRGSWFIQALCGALEEHAKDKDLFKILTFANRKVAQHYKSYKSESRENGDLETQVPLITSTLTRNVRFS